MTPRDVIAAAIYDHVWFGGGNPDELPWLPNTTGRLTQYAPLAQAILEALTKGNTMSRYQITFTQTLTQPVTVEADSLEQAQDLAAKHICRQGCWTLDRDQYVVDGRLVETARV